MCNKIHLDRTFKKIPKSGKGYKLFYRAGDGQLLSLSVIHPNGRQNYKPTREDGWIKFNHKLAKTRFIDQNITGFCFFPNKRTASMALERWMHGPNKTRLKSQSSIPAFTNVVRREIEYREGLGSHIEPGFMAGCRYRIAICQEFKLVLKEGDKI